MWILGIIGVLLFIDLICFISDKYIFSFILLLATAAGSWYFIPDIAVLAQTYGLVELSIGYIAIGVVVAAAKWFIANLSLWLKLRNAREDFQKRFGAGTADVSRSERHHKFARYWNDNYARYGNSLAPKVVWYSPSDFEHEGFLVKGLTLRAKEHIERITFWVLQWPIVIVATALEDLLVNIGRNVARFFDYAFTQLSRRIVASTIKDL